MPKFSKGNKYREPVLISIEQGKAYAKLSGDSNPIHTDHDFASNTKFGEPIAHGMFVAGIFSKILGTKLPGRNTIYISQNIKFHKPVFYNIEYYAELEITKIVADRHRATIKTSLYNKDSEIIISGEAYVQNRDNL